MNARQHKILQIRVNQVRNAGHGFRLHGGALAAKEMGGSLTVHSDGIGHGATFTLDLPSQPEAPAVNLAYIPLPSMLDLPSQPEAPAV